MIQSKTKAQLTGIPLFPLKVLCSIRQPHAFQLMAAKQSPPYKSCLKNNLSVRGREGGRVWAHVGLRCRRAWRSKAKQKKREVALWWGSSFPGPTGGVVSCGGLLSSSPPKQIIKGPCQKHGKKKSRRERRKGVPKKNRPMKFSVNHLYYFFL
jgi:hypothetical protein